MISYEQIYTCGEKKKSCNLIFLPPLGVRFFDVDVLAPYAVEADQMLIYEVHMLWLTVLEQYKKRSTEHGTGCDEGASWYCRQIKCIIQCV